MIASKPVIFSLSDTNLVLAGFHQIADKRTNQADKRPEQEQSKNKERNKTKTKHKQRGQNP